MYPVICAFITKNLPKLKFCYIINFGHELHITYIDNSKREMSQLTRMRTDIRKQFNSNTVTNINFID